MLAADDAVDEDEEDDEEDMPMVKQKGPAAKSASAKPAGPVKKIKDKFFKVMHLLTHSFLAALHNSTSPVLCLNEQGGSVVSCIQRAQCTAERQSNGG